jgi:uncharacterized protein
MLPITSLCTGILGLLFLFHSVRTILARKETRTNLGAGESDLMLRRIRIHGNFAEYIPFLLFMMALLEFSVIDNWVLYAFGSSLVLGRLLHMYGLHSPTTPGSARIIGMVLTFLPLMLGSVALIFLAL